MMTTPAPPGSFTTTPVLQVPTAIDYTSKDYTALAQSMLAYGSVVMPTWNQASEGDFGIALVEMFAYMGDILSYYGDRIGQEAYLPTATQRLSLLNIAKLLGYTVSNGTPAIGTVTFQSTPNSPQISIPAGTQVATAFNQATNSPIVYETTQNALCSAAGGKVTVPVAQGVTSVSVPVGITSGLPGQEITLPATGIIDGSVSIYVQTTTGSQQWSYIQYLVDAVDDDMVWTSFVDANGFTNIQFGDNINGLVPSIGLQVWATYTVGQGAAGNVAAGTVGLLVTAITGLSVASNADGTYQSTVMSGGADPETNDQIRANAPASFQTQNRAVSPADFESMVLSVPGVTAASVVANHSTSVTLYVLGPSYQPPATGMTSNILGYFAGKTLAGVTVTVGTPVLVPINVGATGSGTNYVQIQARSGYLSSVLAANVQSALTALFQPPSATFGQLITLSMIMQTIMNVPGVDWCSIPQFSRTDAVQTTTAPIQLRASEIAVPGTYYITVNGGL